MTEVVLLTQPECALCEHAKEVLARVSIDHPLNVVEVDTGTEEGKTLVQRTGIVFAPGVLVHGRLFSMGRLSERKLRRELSLEHERRT